MPSPLTRPDQRASHLTHIERQKLEDVLRMGGGYVLDFSDRTIAEFFRETVGVDIYSATYDRPGIVSKSKANRMRGFWQVASRDQLAVMFRGLLDGWSVYSRTTPLTETGRQTIEDVIRKLESPAASAGPREKVEPILPNVSQRLMTQLIELGEISPQERGFKFERFLKDLFDGYQLSARASFRLTGEQIDGSFVVHNETYLLEAKWQNGQIGAADLHVFEGKLSQKATWSRGLFVSHSGFSPDGLEAFGRGKRMICMDGFDLHEMLRTNRSLVDVIDAKIRRAAETGSPFASVRELFP